MVDRAVIPDSGAVHKFCLSAAGGPLRVTLAWADRPPAQASGPQLVNDLDLEAGSRLALGCSAFAQPRMMIVHVMRKEVAQHQRGFKAAKPM